MIFSFIENNFSYIFTSGFQASGDQDLQQGGASPGPHQEVQRDQAAAQVPQEHGIGQQGVM